MEELRMKSSVGWTLVPKVNLGYSGPRSSLRDRGAGLLLLVLELIEPVVDAAAGEQFLVRAGLPQLALVEDQDPVHALDG
jgi:hypothetical protein